MKKILKIIVFMILIIVVLTGIMYLLINKSNIFKKLETSQTDNLKKETTYIFKANTNLDTKKFDYINGFLYRRIYDYEEYLLYKNELDVEMNISEKDFEKNFMIIIISENRNLPNPMLDEYINEDEILRINLIEYENNDELKCTGLVILLEKDKDREELVIEQTNKSMIIKSYENIRNLPKEYSLEQAISDKCFVINEMNNYNTDKLKEFTNNVNNGIDDEIRICNYINSTKLLIYDIQYTENKFNICCDYTRYSRRYDI